MKGYAQSSQIMLGPVGNQEMIIPQTAINSSEYYLTA
jgi:hypothetical protein